MAGVLSRAQIENEALDNVAKSGVLTLQSGTTLGTRMTTWANRSQLVVARRADLLQYTATSSTVASQQTYSFPDNFRKIYTMKLEDGLQSRKLTCVMPWEFDRAIALPSVQPTQRSLYYVPYSQTQTFELFPIPDNTYTLRLRYSIYPPNFSSANATSVYTNLDDALVCYSTMLAFRWLQELKDAAYWQKAGDEIVDMISENSDEQYPDWAPASEGFTTNDIAYTGEYYNNPFVQSGNLNTWWR